MSDVESVAAEELRGFITRIERLEEEKASISDDIKDVFGEAKGRGYCPKTMKVIIKLRKKDANERTEEETILHTYLVALGMAPAFEAAEPASREDRAKRRMSESMDDTKAMSAEAVALGLISEDGHAETVAIADAVARKYGNGPISAKPLQYPRNAAEAVSERTATIQPETANETPKQVYGDSGAAATALPSQSVNIPAGGDHAQKIDGSDELCPAATNSPETATEEDAAPKSAGVMATSVESVNPAGGSLDANTGGDHVTASDTANPDKAGILVQRVPATFNLRPNCLRPENCAGHGSRHCHACTVAMREEQDE